MEHFNFKKDPFGNTNMKRNWGMLASFKYKTIWKSELLQTRGLKQFKASALDIQHGFNPQILTISITSSCECPPFGYPTLHHWNRQHQNWAKHGRYEKTNNNKISCLERLVGEKNKISMAYFKLHHYNPRVGEELPPTKKMTQQTKGL